MKDYHKTRISWEMEILRSSLFKGGGRGTFSLVNNNELVLAYNQENKHNIHEKGYLVRVKQKEVKVIFKTKRMFWDPVMDGDDIYLVTVSVIQGEIAEQGVIFKFGSENTLEWQYQLDGGANSLPVVWEDSVFITDFMEPTRSGHLYRISKNGELILKKQIQSFNHFEPWILKNRKLIIVSFESPKVLQMLDFKGNIRLEKSVSYLGTPLFSQNDRGDLFASINKAIVELDNNLDIVWEYKPENGFAYMAPVIDSEGNLFSLISGHRLVSIDPNGKERWVTDIFGQGYQPCILNNGDILIATSNPTGKRAKEERNTTYIEIFSRDGEKILNYKLPGTIFHVVRDNNDTIYVATGCGRPFPKEGREERSFRIFSLSLS
jgi:hypothetical protein